MIGCWLRGSSQLVVFLSVAMSFCMVAYEGSIPFRRGIFDYTTGAVDCIFFLIGSMYVGQVTFVL
jgi:hypothetical protein